MAPVRKIKKPLKKTRKKSVTKRKKSAKRHSTVKSKAEARKKSPRMEYVESSNFASMQHYSTIDDTLERKKLEEVGFNIKSLSYTIREKILKRLAEFDSHPYKPVYESIFVMLTASNALRNNYEKIINITHLPFFEDVKSLHEDLLLLRLSSLADILDPAKKSESGDIRSVLINATANTLSKISNKFSKKSLENNIFTELNNMFVSEPLPKFINFCIQVGNDISKVEEHAKTIDLHDTYVKKFSDY